MYVGPKHTVKDLVSYVAAKMKETTKADIDCKGLTSTWALAEEGLVFCEEDHIFELDGWDAASPKIQFVAFTGLLDDWIVEG